jgi:phosphonopyruvate decarboxylase
MIRPEFFIETLRDYGINFFAGVPDSLLKNICAYITDHFDAAHNIISANEGAAVGLAAGHYLATGKPACVYMQNSGEGNIINPIASLTDQEVYNIPVLLLIGWRGRPGVHDEPQHVKQGKITTGLLNVMGINYEVLSKEEDKASKQIEKAVNALKNKDMFALVIEKDTFEEYKLQNVEVNDLSMSREKAIQTVAAALDERDCIVSTTGMISRELFEYRAAMGQGHERDFLTVGSMGHASQIALGIALAQPKRRVWCFDGDGATIMHMGSLAIIANKSPKNYIHVVFNNGAHDSVGGQPTVGLKIDLPAAAKALGYMATYSVDNKAALEAILNNVKQQEGPVILEVKVKKGNRKDLGRPTTTPIQNKEALMNFLSK